MVIDVWVLLVVFSVPSAVTGFCFWLLQRRMQRQTNIEDEREGVHQKHEELIAKLLNASIALGEATAKAMKSGKVNGEMEAALEFAVAAKHEHKEFITREGLKNIHKRR